jgi:hypothetical protein
LSPLRALCRRPGAALIECVGVAVVVIVAARATGGGPVSGTVRATAIERLLVGPAAERPVALAFVDDGRLLAVTASEVRLLRLEEAGVLLLSHVELPEPRHAVRFPAALIALDGSGSAAWVLSNRDESAHLVDLEGDRLSVRVDTDAEALPWPGSLSGVRYREGTDWIEGSLEALGTGPFLALARSDEPVGVSTGGLLLRDKTDTSSEAVDLTVGPMLAPLWPGVIATSGAKAPGARDAIVVLERRAAFEEAGVIPVEGAVRALAGHVIKGGARLVASIEREAGYELLRLDLEKARP